MPSAKIHIRLRLVMARCERGVSQREMAESIGVSRVTLARIERGRHEPSLTVALKIAKYLNTSVEDLFQIRE